MTASYDFNTNQTAYGYDALGRLVNIVKPCDTTPGYPTVEYDYALAVPFAVTGLINYVETGNWTGRLGQLPISAVTTSFHVGLSMA